jgi:hypothetical protein
MASESAMSYPVRACLDSRYLCENSIFAKIYFGTKRRCIFALDFARRGVRDLAALVSFSSLSGILDLVAGYLDKRVTHNNEL